MKSIIKIGINTNYMFKNNKWFIREDFLPDYDIELTIDNLVDKYKNENIGCYSPEEKAALTLYTIPGNIHKKINEFLHNNAKDQFEIWEKFFCNLHNGIKKSNKFVENKILFRGIEPNISKIKYTEGKIITWYGFSSATSDFCVASKFLGKKKDGILFIIQANSVADISEISVVPEEKEFLFINNSKFRVVKGMNKKIIENIKKKYKLNCQIIELEQISYSK
jgi:ADP-ribosyltransferase exoenzyme